MGLGKRLARIARHRWTDETDTARALGDEALARLEARVSASERRHSGEIRLCVEAGLPLSYLWRDATPRQRAVIWASARSELRSLAPREFTARRSR